MQAWRIHEYGGIDKLRLEEVPRPVPKAGELLVKLSAASLNPIDWKIREGHLQRVYQLTLPRVLGRDGAGTVIESQSPDFNVGDRVLAVAENGKDGTQSEYFVVPASQAARIPDNVPDDEAVAFGIAGTSAWQPLVEIARVAPGMRVLLHAGAGGVGSVGVQLARHFGTEVAATCGPKNVDYVRQLGAQTVIDYTREDFVAAGPFDVVFDNVAGDVHTRSYAALKPGGLLVYINAGPIPAGRPRDDVRVEAARIAGTTERLSAQLELASKGAIRGQVGQTFAFKDLPRAYESIQTGHTRGKIVIRAD